MRKELLKYIKKLDRSTQVRIIKSINGLPLGDVKKLQGNTESYRLRVDTYTIIFNKDDDNLIILVLDITPRGEAYKKLI